MTKLTVTKGTVDRVHAIFVKHGVDRVVANHILNDMLGAGIVIRERQVVKR